MKINMVKIHRNSRTDHLFIVADTALASPFHDYSAQERILAKVAYKHYLYAVLEESQDPIECAVKLGKQFGVAISNRWTCPTVEEIQGEARALFHHETLNIGWQLEHDPALGLADYLNWKVGGQSEQLSIA